MKSIMEQASSIMKAIEKAWISAENPKEFTVKIFEKEEKNFFGMTTKPAKIGIFFSDKNHGHDKSHQKSRPETSSTPPTREKHLDKATDRTAEKIITKAPEHKKQHVAPTRPAQQPKKVDLKDKHIKQPDKQKISQPAEGPKPTATWNETMQGAATTWIKKTLSLMDMHNIDFNTEVAGKNLKFTFTKPLLENPITEKNLFRSIAHLIIASLRNQYKSEIKDLKVVLIRPQ